MKNYILTPITETAEQATEAKDQKGKIAKQIVLGTDAHLNGYQVARKIDAGGIQPVQSFKLDKFLVFARKQLELAEKVYAVYEAGPLGYVLYRKLKELGSRRWPALPNAWKQAASASTIRLMPANWPGGFIAFWVGIVTPYTAGRPRALPPKTPRFGGNSS